MNPAGTNQKIIRHGLEPLRGHGVKSGERTGKPSLWLDLIILRVQIRSIFPNENPLSKRIVINVIKLMGASKSSEQWITPTKITSVLMHRPLHAMIQLGVLRH